MKLVIATPLYPPEIGGPATYSKALEEGLPERGIKVSLVKFCEVRHLPKLVRHIVYFFHVMNALKKADAVLALDGVSVGLPTCLAACLLRKEFVVKIVGDYAWEQSRQRFGISVSLDEFAHLHSVPFAVRFFRMVQNGVVRRARLVIVPSEYLKKIVMSWGVPKDKIHVIYNAVPHIDSVGVVPEAVAALPRPLVVTAGRLVPWKNIEGVIDACARVKDVSLAIVGEGPEHDAFARRAREVLTDDRSVLTGALLHDDLLAVLRSADIFILNSSYEGLSHVLIEALSLGVPTIATDAGGNAEVITDSVSGVLVEVGNTDALSKALALMLSDSSMRKRLSARARESAKRFSQNAMLEAVAHVLGTINKL